MRTPEGGGIISGSPVTGYDYEAPSGLSTYRAQALHYYTARYGASAWVQDQASMAAVANVQLKHPSDPRLNFIGELRSFPSHSREARQTVHMPLGRSEAIVISDTRGPQTGTLVLVISNDDERDRIAALASAADPVLLQMPLDYHEPDRWISLGAETIERLIDKGHRTERNATYEWTEVARPAGGLVIFDNVDPYEAVVMTDSPALYWRLNEASGTTLADYSGNGNTGKIFTNQVVGSTGVVIGAAPLIVESASSGKSMQILGSWNSPPTTQTYPGTGFRADAYKPFLPGSSRSFECWLKKTEQASFATIFSGSGAGGPSPQTPHPTWEMGASGLMRYYAKVNTYPVGWIDWGSVNTGHPRTDFTLNAAHHIVCTFNDQTGVADWWIDGVSQGPQGPSAYSGATLKYDTVTDPGLFQFGWRGGNPPFPNPGNAEVYGGYVDEIAVYEYILSPAQIRKHHRAGLG